MFQLNDLIQPKKQYIKIIHAGIVYWINAAYVSSIDTANPVELKEKSDYAYDRNSKIVIKSKGISAKTPEELIDHIISLDSQNKEPVRRGYPVYGDPNIALYDNEQKNFVAAHDVNLQARS